MKAAFTATPMSVWRRKKCAQTPLTWLAVPLSALCDPRCHQAPALTYFVRQRPVSALDPTLAFSESRAVASLQLVYSYRHGMCDSAPRAETFAPLVVSEAFCTCKKYPQFKLEECLVKTHVGNVNRTQGLRQADAYFQRSLTQKPTRRLPC